MFTEEQQILCGYTKGMIEEAAGKPGRGWPEKALKHKGFLIFFFFFSGGGQILKSYMQKNNQIFSMESLAATAEGRRVYHAKTEGLLRQVSEIPTIKFLIRAEADAGTSVSLVKNLPPLWVL